ncbi:MAG: glycine zipper 2TM domain-containing protein [Holosporales bacterium]|jgi:outer membrane lipoprotein SlyB|nr:glycine zipper 2TM domain-containing protein [Holosporales bacterium]
MQKNSFYLIPFLLLTACVTIPGSTDYQAGSIGYPQVTLRGIVVGVRQVKITDASNTGVGTAIGGGAGAALGALVGGSNHRLLGAGVGGAAGLLGGHLIGKKTSVKPGHEYQVQADNGILYTIVQGPDVVLAEGQRVIITLPTKGTAGRLVAY